MDETTSIATTFIGPDKKPRCRWCSDAPEFLAYHDSEWGFPVADDQRLFEKLCLEGFQAGLSWRTILATEGVHPYISAWWPAGHIIGYENTFVNQAADVLTELAHKKKHVPDFEDAAKTQAVLDAVLDSAKKHAWVDVPKV